MYRKEKQPTSTLKGIEPYKGESIEKRVARAMSNKEPINDHAPLIYTDRKDGVQPDYDIRTDKWEYLAEGHDALAKSKRAKRDTVPDIKKDNTPQNDPGTPSNTSD